MDLLTLLKIYLCLASITYAVSIWKSISSHFPLMGKKDRDKPKALPGASPKDHPSPGE